MKELQSFCGKNCLQNVQFLSYVPRERFNEIMKTAGIGLVTQNPDCVGSIVPSKFYSGAAVGTPILYIGAAHAAPARLMDQFQCGSFVQAGQSGSARGIRLSARGVDGSIRFREMRGCLATPSE